jgi:hypothetical protein
MATVKAEDLGPGVTAITWKGEVYQADADGNITIDDPDFDPAHAEEQGEKTTAAAEAHDRTATEAEPGVEPKEEGRERPAAGESEAEEKAEDSDAPRRGRPPRSS